MIGLLTIGKRPLWDSTLLRAYSAYSGSIGLVKLSYRVGLSGGTVHHLSGKRRLYNLVSRRRAKSGNDRWSKLRCISRLSGHQVSDDTLYMFVFTTAEMFVGLSRRPSSGAKIQLKPTQLTTLAVTSPLQIAIAADQVVSRTIVVDLGSDLALQLGDDALR
jgi:hypothetical protein